MVDPGDVKARRGSATHFVRESKLHTTSEQRFLPLREFRRELRNQREIADARIGHYRLLPKHHGLFATSAVQVPNGEGMTK